MLGLGHQFRGWDASANEVTACHRGRLCRWLPKSLIEMLARNGSQILKHPSKKFPNECVDTFAIPWSMACVGLSTGYDLYFFHFWWQTQQCIWSYKYKFRQVSLSRGSGRPTNRVEQICRNPSRVEASKHFQSTPIPDEYFRFRLIFCCSCFNSSSLMSLIWGKA